MSAVDPALRVADFFVEANAAVWRRDLPLMRRMGVNAMRLYELQAEGDHNAFLDLAYELNITVFAGFPLHSDVHDLLDETSPVAFGHDNILALGLQAVKLALRQAINANRHPAVGMWLVGNEINLASNRFVCEEQGFCKFWDNMQAAFGVRIRATPLHDGNIDGRASV
jgi:hypothetical protein